MLNIFGMVGVDHYLFGDDLTQFTLKSCLFLCMVGNVITEKLYSNLKYCVFNYWARTYNY